MLPPVLTASITVACSPDEAPPADPCADLPPRTECEAAVRSIRNFAPTCAPDDVVYEPQGTFEEFASNEELEKLEGITCFDGTLTLAGFQDQNIEHLEDLTTVTGGFGVAFGGEIVSLDGLDSLALVGRLAVWGMPELTSLDGLEAITEVSKLLVYDLPSLQNADGLRNLRRVGQMSFDPQRDGGLGQATDFSALSSLEIVDYFELSWTGPTVGDLPALECVGVLTSRYGVVGPDVDLVSLEGLENLREIHTLRLAGEGWLESLDGLAGLERILDAVYIAHNPQLPYDHVMSFLDGVDTEGAAIIVDYLPGAPEHPGVCPFSDIDFCVANDPSSCGSYQVFEWPDFPDERCLGVCDTGGSCYPVGPKDETDPECTDGEEDP